MTDLTDLPDWYADAACVGEDPALFLGARRAEPIAICRRCPVRSACLDYALTEFDNKTDVGVWGGTTARQRQGLRGEHDADVA